MFTAWEAHGYAKPRRALEKLWKTGGHTDTPESRKFTKMAAEPKSTTTQFRRLRLKSNEVARTLRFTLCILIGIVNATRCPPRPEKGPAIGDPCSEAGRRRTQSQRERATGKQQSAIRGREAPDQARIGWSKLRWTKLKQSKLEQARRNYARASW